MRYTRTSRKTGFTLIETMLVMAIMTTFTGIVLIGAKKTNEYINDVRVESVKNEILSFLNTSKMYCRAFNKNGSIIFDANNNCIKFKEGLKSVYKYTFPSGFKIDTDRTSSSGSKIDINIFGFTNDACTIYFFDRNKKSYSTSVAVGTAYVEIK